MIQNLILKEKTLSDGRKMRLCSGESWEVPGGGLYHDNYLVCIQVKPEGFYQQVGKTYKYKAYALKIFNNYKG